MKYYHHTGLPIQEISLRMANEKFALRPEGASQSHSGSHFNISSYL